MPVERLGVIGLGAIGGSVARQARQAGVTRVIAYATSYDDMMDATDAGAVTGVMNAAADVIDGADLVVLAVPPRSILDLLSGLAQQITDRAVIVTDVASVKGPIVARALELHLESHFVGSHPLCGTHASGFAAASSDLFREALVYVTPTGVDSVTEQVVGFWRDLMEARTVLVPAKAHDDMLAWTSHLPQAVSSALAAALADSAYHDASFGSGARDTTRLASSNIPMWRDILMLNRSAILAALSGFDRSLKELKRALDDRDAPGVERWLDRGAEFRRSLTP